MREKGDVIWALNPDGSRVELTRLEAVTQARLWNDVCFGALVSQQSNGNAPASENPGNATALPDSRQL